MSKMVWDIVRETGWTLDYIESLPWARLEEYLQIKDGEAHARSSIINRRPPEK